MKIVVWVIGFLFFGFVSLPRGHENFFEKLFSKTFFVWNGEVCFELRKMTSFLFLFISCLFWLP